MLRDPLRRRLFLDHLARWFWSDRYRNLLSSLGLVLGLGGITVAISLVLGDQRRFVEEMRLVGADTLSVRASHGVLPEVSAEGLRSSVPQVRRVSRVRLERHSVATSQGRDLGVHSLLAVDGGFFRIVKEASVEGRSLSEIDVVHARPVCLLGRRVADALGRPSEILVGGTVLEVVGVVSGAAADLADENVPATLLGSAVVVPISSGLVAAGASSGAESLIVQVGDESMVEEAGLRLERVLATQVAGGVEVVTARDLLDRLRATKGHVVTTLSALSLLAMLLGGLGILNNMAALVLERLPEIGIRVAMGATQRDILLQFLSEAVVVTTVGAMTGTCAGWLVLGGLAVAGTAQVAVTWWLIVLPPLAGLIMGVSCGALPAAKAARMQPIDTLTFR